MGDDLPDLRLARRSAVFVAVANARPEVRARAQLVTRASGGAGAVRELAELVLHARGRWRAIVDAHGGEIRAETVSGDLRLHLARGSSARVSAESFSGDLEAPGAQVRKERFGPGSSLEASFGGGDGRIRVETFSGDFTLSLD